MNVGTSMGTANLGGNGSSHRGHVYNEVLERKAKRDEKDPALSVPGMPPNFGKDLVPHVLTFQGILSSIAKVYRPSDESLRDSLANARFMRNDCSIMESLEQRQRSTALLDWHLEPEDPTDPAAEWLVTKMTAILKRTPRFMQFRENLLSAIWYGRAAVRNRYEWQRVDGCNRIVIAHWLPVHGDKLVFRYDDGSGTDQHQAVGIRVGAGYSAHHPSLAGWVDNSKRGKIEQTDYGLAYFLDPYERDLLIIHRHQIEDGEYEDPQNAGRINGVGIRSRIYWTWFQKQESLAWLMEYMERSAFGIEIWYYPSGNPEAKTATREAAEERIGQGRNIILVPRPPGDQAQNFGVDKIENSMAGANALQDILTNYFGHQIKRYILGQTLTTEASNTGLGSNLGDIHMATYLDIIKYDATNLEETMSEQTVKILQDYNFPQFQDIRLRFVIHTETEDVDTKLTAWRQAFDMGVKLKARDVYEMIGASEPTADDETLSMEEQQQALSPPMPASLPAPGGGGVPFGDEEEEGMGPFDDGGDEEPPDAGFGPESTAGMEVGDTKRENGQTYRLNANRRWERYSTPDHWKLKGYDSLRKYAQNYNATELLEILDTGGDPDFGDSVETEEVSEEAAAQAQRVSGKSTGELHVEALRFVEDWTLPDDPELYAKDVSVRIRDAAAETDTNPSDSQKEAGNYRMGRVNLHGLEIAIENPKGSVRSGVDRDGKPWSITMASHYGYIKKTESEADGDHIDVFLGPNPDSEMVYVVDQVNPDSGKFDEHKVMLGWTNKSEAKAAYLASYSHGWNGFLAISGMALPVFKTWAMEGDSKTPVHKQDIEKYAIAFEESRHPRASKGTSEGGRFGSSGGGGQSSTTKPQQVKVQGLDFDVVQNNGDWFYRPSGVTSAPWQAADRNKQTGRGEPPILLPQSSEPKAEQAELPFGQKQPKRKKPKHAPGQKDLPLDQKRQGGPRQERKFTDLDKWRETDAQRNARKQKFNPKSQRGQAIVELAEEAGHKPSDVLDALKMIHEPKAKEIDARNAARKHGRHLSRLTSGDMSRMENGGFDHATNPDKIGGSTGAKMRSFDTRAQEFARDNPGIIGDADTGEELAANFWDFIRQGDESVPSLTSSENVRAAFEVLEQAGAASQSEEEVVPFARSGEVEKYIT